MSSSLRDQLLAAGLVNKAQVQQAKQRQRQQSQHRRGTTQDRAAARPAEAAKTARDQDLNRNQQEKAENKARLAQTRQMVEQHRLPRIESDDYYNFIDGKKIKRIPVNAELRDRIVRGELAIVRCDGRYELVTAVIASRIRERDEQAVVKADPAATGSDENDPYKDYAVPDDMTW